MPGMRVVYAQAHSYAFVCILMHSLRVHSHCICILLQFTFLCIALHSHALRYILILYTFLCILLHFYAFEQCVAMHRNAYSPELHRMHFNAFALCAFALCAFLYIHVHSYAFHTAFSHQLHCCTFTRIVYIRMHSYAFLAFVRIAHSCAFTCIHEHSHLLHSPAFTRILVHSLHTHSPHIPCCTHSIRI